MIKSTNDGDFKKKGIFALFKGIPGSRKSTAALSFPSPLVFDIDCKMPAIAVKHFRNKKIDWQTCDDIWDLQKQLTDLLKSCPYETLIFDTVTSLSTLCLNSIGTKKGENIMSMLATPYKDKKGEMVVDSMGFDYYNGEKNFFERFLIQIGSQLYARDGFPNHVIFNAHILTTESHNIMTNETSITRSIVTAGKQAATMIEKSFDETYFFDVEVNNLAKTSKSMCYTQPKGQDMARTSFGFPSPIDWTDKNFYQLLNGYAQWEK